MNYGEMYNYGTDFGTVDDDYANLFKQASAYAKTKMAVQTAPDSTRTLIFAGAAGLAAVLLLVIVLRR